MSDAGPIHGEEPRPLPPELPEQPGAPEPMQAPQPQQPDSAPEVFWGYIDLCLFVFFFLVGLIGGSAVLVIEKVVFHFKEAPVAALLPAQLVTYAILFGGLKAVFRYGHDRPFWRSLGWTPLPIAPTRVVLAGIGAAFAVVISGGIMRLPEGPNPMKDLVLQGGVSLVLLAAFGVFLAPLCEELAFRGFIQPLLVRSLGAAPGILISAVAFGLLHYQEYGNSWKHAVLISGAGAAFGVMRHFTRSTKAAVLMHAAYNGILFLLLAVGLAAERNLHH